MSSSYPRPDLTDEEQRLLLKTVGIFFSRRRQDQIKILSLLLVENATLAAECNDHRIKQGFDPLPLWRPKI